MCVRETVPVTRLSKDGSHHYHPQDLDCVSGKTGTKIMYLEKLLYQLSFMPFEKVLKQFKVNFLQIVQCNNRQYTSEYTIELHV